VAAFRLHGEGVFDLEALAREADVSPATVRKHFPTREVLFEHCTAYGMHLVSPPDLPAIRATPDAAERTLLAVRQVYALHESLFGQIWGAYKLEDESPALAAVIGQVADVTASVADLIIEGWQIASRDAVALQGFTIGLLTPLTYRSMRVYGGLSPEQAIACTVEALLHAFGHAGIVAGKEAGRI
jgi:AcrR family transcriptional regulator